MAASGGGHIYEILDLEPLWSTFDAFIVTEDTALSRSLSQRWPVITVEHFSLGQGRLGAPLRMIAAAIKNLCESACAMLRMRPDVVITTGAGSVFFAVLWARILGSKIILVESYARFDRLSAFARCVAPLAHFTILPSEKLLRFVPDATVIDPLVVLDQARPEKKPLVFVTVGATLPFDRLVTGVANVERRGGIRESLLIQTGAGGVQPSGIETYETLPFERMLSIVQEADTVVCHGGAGSLFMALSHGCKVIAMPRVFELGEHYDNHQAEMTNALAERGLIKVVHSEAELEAAMKSTAQAAAPMARRNPEPLIAHIAALLARWR